MIVVDNLPLLATMYQAAEDVLMHFAPEDPRIVALRARSMLRCMHRMIDWMQNGQSVSFHFISAQANGAVKMIPFL